MKIVRLVLMVLVMLALPAMADDASLMRWKTLKALTQQGAIDNAEVRKAINAVDAEVSKLAAEERAELCGAKRVHYESDPIGFVTYVEKKHAEADAIRKAELAKVDERLGADKAEIDRKISAVTSHTINLAEFRFAKVRSGEISHVPMLDHICKENAP